MAEKEKSKLKIISLGGLNQIGKNITVFEYEDDMFIVDGVHGCCMWLRR